ncbi:NrtA/SsuA/CpmA family ABC transporter substrate-binding protein [Paenibacillus sp. TRM 82003]|uniref:ABC transporter substrate-binding protein n=1 Tax=Kineococcus sp. TRM81007 TaxID=2925831 RepID=UPI001F56009E|nr:NrtA/SsuA/CpmA family ABC transporter substrate-binding protein [Kineococcus sp. TRM81007]MCI2237105.1 NrtA/SsuA/CpmA family ABC transporter substrate-binding protein [Kineococcus sp. TRM81007]MCI3926424.1 NrtA/SsuA/CpmA family ABC transporter substrate-binding protein [Paenibacillus sp. TRM 82003]
MRTTLRSAAAIAGLTVLVSACAAPTSTTGAAQEEGTVTVGTLRGQPHLYTPYFYEEFAPEGTDVEVVLFDSSTDIKNAVVSGAVDFGVAGAPSALAGVAAGQQVRVIASSADGGTGIVATPEVQSPEDLRGKRIGYPRGASQEILLKLALREQGIDPDADVELVNLPFSDMADAMATGQIDAFSSAELGPSIAKQAGAHDVLSPYESPVAKVNIVLMTAQGTIEDDPATVQDVVDAHIQATEHIEADRQDWVDGVVDTFGIDRAVVETSTQNIWPRWDLPQEYRDQVSALADEMVAFDQLPSQPDREAIFDTTFVDSSEFAG